ncbi:AGE family epimerase/isomerase [Salinicola sp. JS01]|uniref:AGE family epimerase/isomerase n=1 Tax=Salinicola sp. JS01 TaxID=3050071 RepID=UPI00255B7F6C|nr:AGE family epimerase/isomerase [Salinicola sp. JS01]WIX34769.1 AGE family epimerase/isomerase [Salinicola sp. JS01]
MPLTSASQVAHHIDSLMGFYHPRCIDTQAGFFHAFTDSGERLQPQRRHLLSSAGFVINYARYAVYRGEPEYLHWARHGLRFLEEHHYQTRTQGYAWLLDGATPEDETQRCLGLARVLEAYAVALDAGIGEAAAGLARVRALIDKHLYETGSARYADSADARWRLATYRSQLANLEMCEALLACQAVSSHDEPLARALSVTRSVWQQLAPLAGGWLWEHFDRDWRVDFELHRDRPDDRYRPWGFQVGHLAQWAKLMTRLAAWAPSARGWLLDTAGSLFVGAMEAGWDSLHGGLVSGVDMRREVVNRDKQHWVQAESLAAAALLADATGQPRYWRWYDRIADYCGQHMIDGARGGWYATLTADNRPYSREKSPLGKTDRRPLATCYLLLPILRRREGLERPGHVIGSGFADA